MTGAAPDAAQARPRCSDTARLAGDPLVATAPPAERWLLVEHCGPWGRRAVTESGLDRTAAAALARWTQTNRARVVLVRRPGAGRSLNRPRRWFLVDSRPGREAVRDGEFDEDRALIDVLSEPAPGAAATDPIYLVCAHGRHDACCAIRGRPVAAALAYRYPQRTWECTHVGGDRFAANLVLLPHGFYYGNVAPELAVDLVELYGRGHLHPALLRGRSSIVPAVQAAQHYARLATGDTAIDSLAVLSVRQDDPATWSVRLATASGRAVAVTVRSRIVDSGRTLTCADTLPGRYRTFDLLTLC